MPLGLYISVPFCRTKCTYCNFASDVFSRAAYQRYVVRVCDDIHHARQTAQQLGVAFDPEADSIYLGGGTPTILDSASLERLFVTIRQNFCLLPQTEITVECAPGTLTAATLDLFLRCGVNRVSLGVQSFVDHEAASVGRLHTRATVLDDIARLRSAGITNINLDLIAGLPHQTIESWETSLDEAIATDAPHVSVYMLEIDQDSRLGRELIAGGTRYHAHFVPDEDLTADLYSAACERLHAAGVEQYEISNFARMGSESRHNLKYWTRQPYFGFGVDAHSMLAGHTRRDGVSDMKAFRFATPDSLDQYLPGSPLLITPVTRRAALEEEFFLGLRLTRGIDLDCLEAAYGTAVHEFSATIKELTTVGLLIREEHLLRLTPRGRLLSNEVFERFLSSEPICSIP